MTEIPLDNIRAEAGAAPDTDEIAVPAPLVRALLSAVDALETLMEAPMFDDWYTLSPGERREIEDARSNAADALRSFGL